MQTTMRKKQYLAPKTENLLWEAESMMITASPGGQGSYNPSNPIESREQEIFDNEEGFGHMGQPKSLWEE